MKRIKMMVKRKKKRQENRMKIKMKGFGNLKIKAKKKKKRLLNKDMINSRKKFPKNIMSLNKRKKM